jgi:hypothetical protein
MSRETVSRRWTRPVRECPDWCAADHTCTARSGYPSGQHRSKPITIRAGYGVLVCTRVQDLGGRSRLEIRVGVDLDPDDGHARVQAQHLAAGVDATIRAILAGRVPDAWLADPAPKRPPSGRAALPPGPRSPRT